MSASRWRRKKSNSRALEDAADRAWELHESEERYGSLERARERAVAANLAKSRFLAIVPDAAQRHPRPEQPADRDRPLTRAGNPRPWVHSSGTALLSLIEVLLDFSKIEAGRLDIGPEPASLNAAAALP